MIDPTPSKAIEKDQDKFFNCVCFVTFVVSDPNYLRTSRTSTAATPPPCARTMIGLISMSER